MRGGVKNPCGSGKKDLISVIIPIYQVEKELPRCLDSLLAQTYPNFELLLIDDGSPDGCFRVMEEYARKDERIRIFQKENGGVSSARNMGLDHARGEYICFADPDDWVAPRYLEWLYQAIVQSGLRLAFCQFRQVGQTQTGFELPENMPEPHIAQIERCSVWSRDFCVQCWRMMAEKTLIQDIRFDSRFAVGEDALFVMQAMLKAGEYVCLPCALYAYWVRPDSAFNRGFTLKQYSEVQAWERIYELVQDKPELKKSAEEKLVYVYAHVYYRMAHSPYADDAKLDELIRKARKHGNAVLRIPNRLVREKGKMLMMVTCPQLGRVLWKIGKKMKQVSP